MTCSWCRFYNSFSFHGNEINGILPRLCDLNRVDRSLRYSQSSPHFKRHLRIRATRLAMWRTMSHLCDNIILPMEFLVIVVNHSE